MKHKMIGKNIEQNGALRREVGFTLIEFLTAMFVASIMLTVIATMFARALSLQRQGFFAQKVQENTMFILERMAKEARVSRIESPPNSEGCGNTSITMIHPVNGTVVYAYDAVGKKITRTDASGIADLSSSDVSFNRVRFCLAGSGVGDNQQARITVSMQMQATRDASPAVIVFNVQTSLTSRDVTTEFQQ